MEEETTTSAAAAGCSLYILPLETITHIFQYLDYSSIVNLYQTCKLTADVIIDMSGLLLKNQFLSSVETILERYKDSDDKTLELYNQYQLQQQQQTIDRRLPFKVFINICKRFEVVYQHYQPIYNIWSRIKKWLTDNNLNLIMNTLKGPMEELLPINNDRTRTVIDITIKPIQTRRFNPSIPQQVQQAVDQPQEVIVSLSLPNDYICSCYMVNGQTQTDYGLFGKVNAYDSEISNNLLSFNSSLQIYTRKAMYNVEVYSNLWPVTFCTNSFRSYWLVCNDVDIGNTRYTRNQVLLIGSVRNKPVVVASSFTEFLEQHIYKLEQGIFTTRNGSISRFPEMSPYITEETTNGVRVKGSAVYVPEISAQIKPYTYFYRITISMDKDEDKSRSCRLLSRHWDIVDGNITNVVDGEGVIGEYPIITPGSKFEYCSICDMSTEEGGTMSGYFNFVLLNNIIEQTKPYQLVHSFKVIVPPFTLSVNQN